MTDDLDAALLAEGLKKAALVWLRIGERDHARWHTWSGEHIYLLTGPDEQPDPGLPIGGRVRVVARSKDNHHRLLEFDAEVTVLSPSNPDWDPATAALASARLNLREAASAPQRWATGGAVVFRLTPRPPIVTEHGAESRRAAPADTPATTQGPPPKVLHRRARAARPLS